MEVQDTKEVSTFTFLTIADCSRFHSLSSLFLCRLYTAYPECLGMDVTHGTNQEKRPIFRLVGRTPNNKSFPVLCVLMPCESDWAFRLIFETVIPELFGHSIRYLRILTTDEDWIQIQGFRAFPNIYPLAKLRYCKWHKVCKK